MTTSQHPRHPPAADTEPRALGEIAALSARLAERGSVLVGGTESAGQKTMLYAAAGLSERFLATVWIVRDEKEARTTAQLLRFWQPTLTIRVFGEDPTPVVLDHLYGRRAGTVILPLEAFDARLPDEQQFRESMLTVRPHFKLTPQELVEHLTVNGYEGNRSADGPGVYARRGGVVDVFSPNLSKPVRIEFEGSTVTLVATVDPLSKRLGPPLSEVALLPLTIDPDVRGVDLFTYLPSGALAVYADPDLLAQNHPSWATIEQKLKTGPCLQFSIFETEGALTFDLRSAKFYHYRLPELAKDLHRMTREGWRIFLATIDRQRITDFLKQQGLAWTIARHPLDWLKASPGTIAVYPVIVDTLLNLQGFAVPASRAFCLTDREIFGLKVLEQSESRLRSVDLAMLQDIVPGDYLVHLDHGVGKFQGLTRQPMNGFEREYFVLEYAEGDKLFVPIEGADKIAKYIGAPHPKLHRLSGTSWQQLTFKIKEDAMRIARELLTLYAQRELAQAPALDRVTPEERRLIESFPYRETPDQQRTIEEVMKDLTQEQPMDRLVCGDVGFGKTEVAIRAAVRGVMNGVQVAVLSPTTILTQQHFDTFAERLKGLPVRVDLLSRFRSDEQQAKTVVALNRGEVDVIVGTHRLLSPDIQFKNLGLVIIDEEQRFGVKHKELLRKLRTQAHVLTLSATPIPRTLNFALSGIKDLSVIETPPEGRLPIETLIKPYDEELVKQALRAELKRGGQVYFVYNHVETISLAAKKLRDLLPKARFAIAHGQMDEESLSQAMDDFDHHRTDILVCSTIIENGLDLPNVNTLIVDHAQKFGLAQLYQLRGRIGRGNRQAYAYFLYHSQKLTEAPKKRLKALAEARELGSGLQLALKDLEIRGTGNILGKSQHGHVAAVGLNLYTRLLAQAVEELRTGVPQRPAFEVTIDLPIPIGLPPSLVPSEVKRIQLYRRIARLVTEKDLTQFKQSAFGTRATGERRQRLPEMVENLFKLLRLKLRCQAAQIKSIQLLEPKVEGIRHKRVIVTFAQTLTPERIEKVVKHNSKWDFSLEVVKIDAADLGDDWLHDLTKFATVMADDKKPAAVPR